MTGKPNLRNSGDAMSTRHHQGGKSRGGEGRCHSIATLVNVNLAVPLAPDLGGRKHATLATHVAKRGLAGAIGAATRNTGNTRHGATSTWLLARKEDCKQKISPKRHTPRFGGVLMTSLLLDGVRLTLVLVHVGMHILNNVGANRGKKDSRERQLLTRRSTSKVVNRNQRTSSHGIMYRSRKSNGLNEQMFYPNEI